MADGLDQIGATLLTNLVDERPPLFPVLSVNANLDERMVVKRQVGSGRHGRGDPGRADHDHRFEAMGPGAKTAFRGRFEQALFSERGFANSRFPAQRHPGHSEDT